MEIINQTPFHVAPINGRLNFPGHSLTFIVKGTFDLRPDQVVLPSEEQIYPTGDEFFPDDVDMQGSCRYESDFAYFKPRADLLLSGHCHAPGGKPIPACQVKFQVGSREKTLNVFGDRQWKRSFGFSTISDPEPFTQMKLKYENSFGGQRHKKNPVGKGFSKQKTKNGKKERSLPNIEDPQNMIGSPRSRPEPAGFGPLGKMWEQRSSRMGNYKGKYLEERWPWFPDDFDWGHFNAAPPDMQVEGYLRGDEALLFENLHPAHPKYKSNLPGIRAKCFVNISAESESEVDRFEELSLNLDTLWVDMEAEKIVLVWRGWMEVLSEDYEELKHVFILSEPVDKTAQTMEQYKGAFLAALADYDKEWEISSEEPEEMEEKSAPQSLEKTEIESPEPAVDADIKAADQKEKEALAKNIEAQTAVILAQMGISLDSLPQEAQLKAKEQQAKIISQLANDNPAEVMEIQRKELLNQMKDSFGKMGVDTDNPPPISAKARVEQARFMKELGVDPVMIKGDPNFGMLFAAIPALLPKMGVDPENLEPLLQETKKRLGPIKKQLGIEETEGTKEGAEKPSPLTREIVKERALNGKSFIGEDLSGLDLSSLDLQQLDFSGANLAGVSLDSSNLSCANLEGADISDALMIKADLSGTNMSGAYMKKADLTEAMLEQANLTGALLTGAILSNANAGGVTLISADLSSANLTSVNLEGADLSNATLNDAGLGNANLSGTNQTGAKLVGADLKGADLSGATLTGADLTGADLEETNLKDMDITEGNITDARLVGASMIDAIFEEANMTNSVFDKVDAKSADFTGADLVGSSFREAELSEADFSESLIHDADFQRANLSDANFYGAQGTKVNFKEANLSGFRASDGCDFTEGNFVMVFGPDANWEDAKLDEADFSFASMDGAFFTKASLVKANFSAASMKHSRFVKANLRGATLVQMNLFESSLEKADLTEADLRGSNLFRAEFLDTVLERTILDGTNIKMTKLAKKE